MLHFLLITVLLTDLTGKVGWTGEWIADIDSFLHLALISNSVKNLQVPTAINTIHIDPKKMTAAAGQG